MRYLLILLLLLYPAPDDPVIISGEQPVAEILSKLGDPRPAHYLPFDSTQVAIGEELVKKGRSTLRKGRVISPYYACTSCHNLVKESADIMETDPYIRLQYAEEQDIPYLQGSTFRGIVNRESWYNGDYVKKYGTMVEAARNSLAESIQLCAQECSQGRKLEPWELENITAYLWTLEWTLDDLQLNEAELNNLKKWSSSDPGRAIALLKSKYPLKYEASFTDAPYSKEDGYGYEGNPGNGKIIYEQSCQHCHHAYGESDLVLDNSQTTFKWLQKHMFDHDQRSIYQVIRYGTSPAAGHRPYMPLYTQEKMPDRQVEDLRAYIEQQSEGSFW